MSFKNLPSHEITTDNFYGSSHTLKSEGEQLCFHAFNSAEYHVLNTAARCSLVPKYIHLNQKIFASSYFKLDSFTFVQATNVLFNSTQLQAINPAHLLLFFQYSALEVFPISKSTIS